MQPASSPDPAVTTELLLLPNGTVLVHNLTGEMAAILAELDPADQIMAGRAVALVHPEPPPDQSGQGC